MDFEKENEKAAQAAFRQVGKNSREIRTNQTSDSLGQNNHRGCYSNPAMLHAMLFSYALTGRNYFDTLP